MTIPTAADWKADPAAAATASDALIAILRQDAAGENSAVSMGIAAQVLAAAAPLAGEALAGPLGAAGGALAAAGIQALANSLASQHAAAKQALTPDQQQLVQSLIAAGTVAVAAMIPKSAPTAETTATTETQP